MLSDDRTDSDADRKVSHRQYDGRSPGQIIGLSDKQTLCWTDIQTDTRTDRQTDRQIDKQTHPKWGGLRGGLPASAVLSQTDRDRQTD